MHKRVISAIICFIVLLFICGCGKEEETLDLMGVGDSFKSVMEYAGYSVVHDMSSAASDENIKDIEIAIKDDKFQVEMYYIVDSSKATKYFADFSRIFDKKTNYATSTSTQTDGRADYRLESDMMIYRIVQYENKVLSVAANKEYEEEITKIIERLGEIYGVTAQ